MPIYSFEKVNQLTVNNPLKNILLSQIDIKDYSSTALAEHPILRINIVLTSMLLIISNFLWILYLLVC